MMIGFMPLHRITFAGLFDHVEALTAADFARFGAV